MKRVLLSTFPSAFLHQGGGEREILLLNDALNAAGVMSDVFGPTSKSIATYGTLVHFSMAKGSEYIIDDAAAAGIKLILWPNLWFVNEPSTAQIAYVRGLLSRFDAIVFRSLSEEKHFNKYLDTSGLDVIHVAPLISPRFLSEFESDIFRESYSLKDYVIWPGIIEPQKNQLTAVRAFKGLPFDLVLSGTVRDQSYMRQCMDEADENVLFIPPMPFGSELHLSALRSSRLFLELPLDFPGSSALEASAMGCRLMLSRTEWTQEMLGDVCSQVDPTDVIDVRESLLRCSEYWDSPRRAPQKYAPLTDAVAPLVEYLVR